MRKIILKMAVSLDGFVSGPNNEMDWMLLDDNEDWANLFEMLKNVDLFLLGNGMWKEYRDYWKTVRATGKGSDNEIAYAKLAEKTSHIVFSKSLDDAGWENTTINKKPVVEAVKEVKNEPGKDIYVVGGAKFAATLINAGLVDEYQLTINPAIVGSGKSFFREQQSKQLLELISSEQTGTGLILARYKVKK